MKIGGNLGPLGPELHLPIEIVSQIVAHVARPVPSQRSLWSCCLVSHDWYDVAVPHLYKYPRLANKNFDLFTRTICPPISAHVRKVGLEDFVRRLDMGRLAYESTNSLTARLLGRVGPSLEYYVAPPVSFSISCLAPLSKCEQMRFLDLSRVYQSLDVTKLLKAIRKLSSLTTLFLPDTSVLPPDGWPQEVLWPPLLVDLQMPGWLFQGTGMAGMVASWPASLAELTMRHCRTCPLLTDRATYHAVRAPSIKTLTLEDSHQATGSLHLDRVFTVFGSLSNLSIPAEAISTGIPDITIPDLPLETLELTRSRIDEDGVLGDFWKQDLLQCIANLPNLWQLALDEQCLSRTVGRPQPGYEIDDRDELTLPLRQRAEERNRSAGYATIKVEEAGFFFLTG